jgi:L,D-transpeptidase catalytic domain
MNKLRCLLAVAAVVAVVAGGAFAQTPGAQEAPAQPDASAVAGDGLKPAALTAPAVKPPAEAKPTAPASALTPGQLLYNRTRDTSFMDPLSWSVSVHKSRHDLIVYYKGRLFKKYSAVFGRSLDGGGKEYANDRRTPEGVYLIVRKFPSRRFRWFLKLNYPNEIDRERYRRLVASQIIPVNNNGRAPGLGGAIGIHGTDVPILNQGLVNWTTGCISVSNVAIAQLARFLPVGTVVIIKP